MTAEPITARSSADTIADFYLAPDRVDLVAGVRALAREKLAPRAAHYDATATFPHDDFRDLFEAGLLAAALPRAAGGLGPGPYRADLFTLSVPPTKIARPGLSLPPSSE